MLIDGHEYVALGEGKLIAILTGRGRPGALLEFVAEPCLEYTYRTVQLPRLISNTVVHRPTSQI